MPNFPQFNVGTKDEVCDESLTTWVEEVFDSEYSFTARPNPVSDLLIIDAGGAVIDEVHVRDMQGRLLHRTLPAEIFVELNVSLYQAGMYLVTIITDKGRVMTERVIVK
jgi:hypothetical protein